MQAVLLKRFYLTHETVNNNYMKREIAAEKKKQKTKEDNRISAL